MATSNERIVAELGRPETLEERRDRREREAKARRERQTVSNLVLALLASLGVMLVLVLLVPRPTEPIDRGVDIVAAADDAATTLGTEPLLPAISEQANVAELRRSADDVLSWYVGYLTSDGEFIGMTQAVDANPSWVSSQVAETSPVATVELGGLSWDVYDNRDAKTEVGNARYAMVTSFTAADGTEQTVILAGTAGNEQFALAATAVANAISVQATSSPSPN